MNATAETPNTTRAPSPAAEWVVATVLDAASVVPALQAAARRGVLPGLHADGRDRGRFTLRDFGSPLSGIIEGRVAGDGGEGAGSRVHLRVRMARVGPAVFVGVLVLAVWPGLPLTDSMLKSYIPGRELYTWAWYVPVTAVSGLWALVGAVRASRRTIAAESREIIEKVRAAL